MFSILLPTRRRERGLKQAVDSMYQTAFYPDQLETILRVDDDDPVSYSEYRNRGFKVIVGPRLGYKNMHLYYDETVRAATKPWMFVWNDDTTMLTQNWDLKLAQGYSDKLCVQFPKRDILPDGKCDTTFPVFPKLLFSLMGQTSSNCHVDSWLDNVSYEAGILVYRPDVVFHHDRPEDQTAHERVYDWEAFQTSNNRLSRDAQVAKIRDFLERHPEMRP